MGLATDFGKAVVNARTKKKLKQVDLAVALGVTQTTIWRIETGKYLLDVIKFFQLCEMLEIDDTKFKRYRKA